MASSPLPAKPPPITRASSKNMHGLSDMETHHQPPHPRSPDKTKTTIGGITGTFALSQNSQDTESGGMGMGSTQEEYIPPVVAGVTGKQAESPPMRFLPMPHNRHAMVTNSKPAGIRIRRSMSQDLALEHGAKEMEQLAAAAQQQNNVTATVAAAPTSLTPPLSTKRRLHRSNSHDAVYSTALMANAAAAVVNRPTRPGSSTGLPSPSDPTLSNAVTTAPVVTAAAATAAGGLESLRIETEIGRGSRGTVIVFKARSKCELNWVALKRVGKQTTLATSSSTNKDAIREVVNEVRCLHRLRHHRIVGFINWYETKRSVWVVMEYIAGGTLEETLIRCGPLGAHAVAHLALDISDALQYLHNQVGLVHGNLVPKSILLTENGVAKLSAFSRARFVGEGVISNNGYLGAGGGGSSSEIVSVLQNHSSTSLDDTNLPQDSFDTKNGAGGTDDNDDNDPSLHDPLLCCGKLTYAPPEFFQQWADGLALVTSPETDMWALGCLLYESALFKLPFSCGTSFFALSESVREDDVKFPRSNHSQPFPMVEFESLVSQLLCKNMTARLKANGVKEHVFVNMFVNNGGVS